MVAIRQSRRPGASTSALHGESVAAVGHREEAAERHQEAAAPDPVDERLDVHAQRPRTFGTLVGDGLAERHVAVAEEAGVDRGLGHRHAARVVDALLRTQRFQQRAIAAHLDHAGHARVVGTDHRHDAAEREVVAADRDRLPVVERDVLLDAVASHQRDADDEHRDAEMRDDHAVPRRRIGRELGCECSLRRLPKALDHHRRPSPRRSTPRGTGRARSAARTARARSESARRQRSQPRAPSAAVSTDRAARRAASSPSGRCRSGTRAAPSARRTPSRSTADRPRSCRGRARR